MDDTFIVEPLRDGATPGLRLVGEFDREHVDAFDVALREVLVDTPKTLTLDFADLHHLSSVGLTGVLRARSLVDQVAIRRCPSAVRRVFEVSSLDRFFTFIDDQHNQGDPDA